MPTTLEIIKMKEKELEILKRAMLNEQLRDSVKNCLVALEKELKKMNEEADRDSERLLEAAVVALYRVGIK